MLFEKIFQFEKILDAFARRRAPPSRKGVRCGLNGGVHIGCIGKRDAREEFGGGGILDV